jgi:hypothetical protein
MAEALARLSDADEIMVFELQAHTRQHLEGEVQQGGCARLETAIVATILSVYGPIHMNDLKIGTTSDGQYAKKHHARREAHSLHMTHKCYAQRL